MVKRTNLKKPFEAFITDALREARQNNTRPTGDKVFEAGDTATFEGTNGDKAIITGGDITYIGDTVPPAPAGITASGSMSVVTVTWNGSLADPTETLPSDWSHIEVWADGKRMGEIYGSARNSMSFESTAGTTHSIITYAVDKAGNRSEASEPVSVTVESALGSEWVEGLQETLDANEARLGTAEGVLEQTKRDLANMDADAQAKADAARDVAIAAAAADAQTKADAAKTAAIEASGADTDNKIAQAALDVSNEIARVAQEKADAAQAAAVAAAQAYTDANESGVSPSELEAIKADAQAKADAAKQAAIDAAAADATAKATAAETAAKNAAALDAQNKANAAKNAAIAASATDATEKANAAKAAAIEADKSVIALANGKNSITNATVNPNVVGVAVGDVWYKRGADGIIIGQWEWTGGTTVSGWASRTVGDAMVANLNAGKINAGILDADRIGANSITTPKLAANSVTADKIVISSGTNLIPNGLGDKGAGVLFTGDDFPFGNDRDYLLGTNAKGYFYTTLKTGKSSEVFGPLQGGKKYQVRALAKGTNLGQVVYVQVVCLDHTGNNLASPYIAINVTIDQNRWYELSGEFTAPLGTVSARLILYSNHSNGAQNNYQKTYWAELTMIEKTAGELIVDGSIDTDKLAANSVTADKILVNDQLDAKLGNFLHINVENIVATGTASVNSLVAKAIAAGTADFQKVKVENLTAGTGTMDSLAAGKIAGSIIQAGLNTDTGSYRGVKFQASGITAWNGTATPTFNLNASTGDVTINGGTFTSPTIQTSSVANQGLKITPDGLTLFDNAGKALVNMSASGNAEIDGSTIATDSITADKISLVGGDKNVLTSGNGSTAKGWVDTDTGSAITSSEYRIIGNTAGFPAGAKGYFILHTLYTSLGSAKFGITEGNDLKFGLNWRRTSSNTADYMQVHIEFLSRTNSRIEKRFIATLSGGSTNAWQRYDHATEIHAPAGTYQARIIYTRGSGAFQITNTTVLTSVETKLTPTGLTSSINGVETVRLNGEDNMVVGRFRTAPLGLPQVMLSPTSASYNGTQLAVWFTPDGNTPGGITAGLWMENVPTASTAYPLSIRGQGNAGVDIWGTLTVRPSVAGAPALLTTGGQDLLISPSGANTTVAGNKLSLRASGDSDFTSTGVTYIEGSYVRLHSNSSSEPFRITNGTSGATWDYGFTTSSGANMNLGANGTIRKTGSSKRFKVDITPFEPDESFLDIETYKFRDKGAVERAAHIDRDGDLTDEERLLVYEADTWHLGTIAEYAQDKSPLQVSYDLDGNVINYAYDRDGAMLRPFVRKLVHDYKELRAEVDQLKKLLNT